MGSIRTIHYDVVVIGGGSAGFAAAASSAKNGAKTLLIESSPMIGGDLTSGLPIDGCVNQRGEWIVGGVFNELLEQCSKVNGYIGKFYDWRALWIVAVDPDLISYAIIKLLKKYNVSLLLYSVCNDVLVEDSQIRGVFVNSKGSQTLVTGDVFIDCTGDGDIAAAAGAPYEIGEETGELQPVSIVFKMKNINSESFLTFIKNHPENFGLGENPYIGKTKSECALELFKQGIPKAFFVHDGPIMKKAIESGELYKSSMIALGPISMDYKEISVNSTRIAGINAIDVMSLSGTLYELVEQVDMCVNFLKKWVLGFENAEFSGLAPKIGVRETRRIMGDYVLTVDDVLSAKKTSDAIAKGAHEMDLHGSGTAHERKSIKDAGSFDIPFGCLIPRNVENLLIAGRCISSTRHANSAARLMGTCMATGQAAGTAAAICVHDMTKVRKLPVEKIRKILKEQGAILEGTY